METTQSLESLPIACSEATPVPGHEPSLLPAGRDFTLAWHDEFDGDELDRSKWAYRLCMMQKRHPAWVDDAVRLDGKGNAVFWLRIEDGRPVSSQLQTGFNFMDEPVEQTTFGNDHLQWPIGKLRAPLFEHAYGYWECRCRLQQKPGWWSAFWMQSATIGAFPDPARAGVEIDVMESFRPGVCHRHNVFHGGYGKDNVRLTAGSDIEGLDTSAFHRFGVLWDDGGYTFYVDGREHGRVAGHVSRVPLFVLVSTEVTGYRHADHKPVPDAFAAAEAGDTFLVDYVRMFDEVKC